jgi:hypothetical protein
MSLNEVAVHVSDEVLMKVNDISVLIVSDQQGILGQQL